MERVTLRQEKLILLQGNMGTKFQSGVYKNYHPKKEKEKVCLELGQIINIDVACFS